MNRYFRLTILILVSVIFIQCQKEISDSLGNQTNTNTDPVTAVLQGNVLDENGKAAMGVAIRVGSKTATTDARGYFRIPSAPLDRKSSLVNATKNGYYPAFRTFSATTGANQVTIRLIKKTLTGSISASTGGEVSLPNGAKVVLPANGVVQASGGSAYTGNVRVYASYIDPTANEISQVIPGSFMADDKNNNRVTLESYGMMAVELESSAGEKLQVKPGTTATLTTPIPASIQSSAPATIALWYVDEQTGLWKEEGVATKNGDKYVGEVKHFSFWNCDVGVPAIQFSVTLKTNEGVPVVNTMVRIRRTAASTQQQTYGITDSLGQVSGLVPKNENFVLEVLDYCHNPIYTQNIGPFANNTNLGVITISSTTSGLVTLKGKLLNCSNNPVSNGYAIIYYNNHTYYSATDASGNFSRTFTQCGSVTGGAQVLGVDGTAQQQGSMVNLTVTTPVTDAGNVAACGNSSLQYINYNLDDTLHSITSMNSDTLIAFPDSTQGSSVSSFMGTDASNDDEIYIGFNANGTGTFQVSYIRVNHYWYPTLVQPFNVVVTNYPQSPGQFWEGTFSGQFSAGPGNHTITGSFRIRKQ